ncbi:Taurine dioxygenase OS=Tsukamurella paurometabola (strain ATCC 8368 / DSM / CCUG 35730 / CIP 100753 / JCM 10117 / KCTC 9821 / NBRC 16120 / NCIMB 702349/ NCTC 13040) OX=521096 GN=Tpau_0686 PE=3 SV=1 [Tsukamurella paurometabola]|uniref:Taurine dioxygenase n=1 Tax=Tsukamurella paurometabola (strain ATCC 8368 / DSM 20162 / CCUG 35730 / CIP 100753 / JCM 10117 / KCTC 9821 / NBRC 16120 / NCIMB 702349 / NCTC 13040) TaxID=521096 RepID=D5UT36_TSUPD|nr:TauD/TfdA family dioxygenase [Tsukamurella paurometabola]ADG77323.1 Taurine dioxygenase [Tsukamurella paurometabola DSM 20162]SUP43490.1 Alpha-ketoglutarate-dependent taurine dioxygenase [Tsukamurella paurometabola]
MGNPRAIRIGEHIGSRIDGIRLGGDLADEDIAFIRATLLERKVVFFRDQHDLDDAAHQEFGRRLGDLGAVHLNDPSAHVAAIDSEHGGKANWWHTDITFSERPPAGAILRAVQLPDFGGTTIWANTAAAYAQLPAELRRLADALWAVHDNSAFRDDLSPEQARAARDHPDTAAFYAKLTAQTIAAEHPVVHVHPETGERCLLLGVYARRISGYDREDSDALLHLFQRRITRPELTVRWDWQPGDVVIWDNRATQHYAVSDYAEQKRLMRRVVLTGGVPESITGERSRSGVDLAAARG